MTNKITLQFITTEGVNHLKQMIESHLEHFQNKDQQFFLQFLQKNNYLKDSKFDVYDFAKDLKNYSNADDEESAHLHNVKVVHDALKGLDKKTAIDERFWVGINFTILWDFIMENRYNKIFKDPDNKKQVVQDLMNSFFTLTKNGLKRGTMVNYISQLWWAGSMTYDETNIQDPYHLTRELSVTGLPSTMILVSSSNIFNNNRVFLTFLTVIKDRRNKGFVIKRIDISNAGKYLNLIASMNVLDFQSNQYIYDAVNEFMDIEYKKANKKFTFA